MLEVSARFLGYFLAHVRCPCSPSSAAHDMTRHPDPVRVLSELGLRTPSVGLRPRVRLGSLRPQPFRSGWQSQDYLVRLE